MKKILLCALVAASSVLSVNAQKVWDFTGEWSLTEANADANLVLEGSGESARFDYAPATEKEAITFADGTPVTDVEGLLFTAGNGNKLRLGFGETRKALFLNGGSISVHIPAEVGQFVSVEAVPGNGTATNRGFSVEGGIVNAATTPAAIVDGIMTEANGLGLWVYEVTESPLSIRTVAGGMNIKKITVGATPADLTPASIGSDSADAKEIKSTKYYNLLGAEVDANATGVVIVKTTYVDGSVSAEKTIK